MKPISIIFTLILCLSMLTAGCSDISNSNKEQNSVTPEVLNAESVGVKVTKEMELIRGASDLFESSSSFNQVQAFIPNKEYLDLMQVKGEDFPYINLPKANSFITGEIILENNTEEEMNIESLFLQGDALAKIKTSSANEWSSSIIYNVLPFSSVKLEVHIEFNHDGMNELTFFPKHLSDELDRYNGGNIGSVRYYVLNEEIFLDKDDLNKQSFDFDLSEANSEFNFHPTSNWVGSNKKLIEFEIQGNSLIPKKRITGILLDEVPYNTRADLLLIKELGEIVVIEKNIEVRKNEATYFYFEDDLLEQMNNTQEKSYVLLTINREKDLISDLKVLDMDKKPFPTSYQSILEYYQFKD